MTNSQNPIVSSAYTIILTENHYSSQTPAIGISQFAIIVVSSLHTTQYQILIISFTGVCYFNLFLSVERKSFTSSALTLTYFFLQCETSLTTAHNLFLTSLSTIYDRLHSRLQNLISSISGILFIDGSAKFMS